MEVRDDVPVASRFDDRVPRHAVLDAPSTGSARRRPSMSVRAAQPNVGIRADYAERAPMVAAVAVALFIRGGEWPWTIAPSMKGPGCSSWGLPGEISIISMCGSVTIPTIE
ncbi:hypothetical protein NSPZN2_30594 [Nitrospira defluvii]|uniref:Uncharacterized protein n=1 Tax=Nitrospira defluvii TaxID=330214 RepID=A0ABM8RLZ3_9BACT|nr:hypothetical protein NSPZN2_30594 [Nitrospira defluvii]